MSYNIVKKGDSTILVKKFRDGDGKVREHYIMSLGVMTEAQFKEFRHRIHELPQDSRVDYCARSGFMVEVSAETPRRKTPTGDIREPTVKKEKRAKRDKNSVESTRRYIPGVTYAPATYRTHTETMREREIEKQEIKASTSKPIPIPEHIKSKKNQRRFLDRLKQEYREDIKEYKEGIRKEEIRMPPSLYAQRKEKAVIGRHKSNIKAAEKMIERIEKQKLEMK